MTIIKKNIFNIYYYNHKRFLIELNLKNYLFLNFMSERVDNKESWFESYLQQFDFSTENNN